MATFDDDGHHCQRYSSVISLGHVIVEVFAVNWMMYSYGIRFVSVVSHPMVYAIHQPYQMHSLYLLSNPSTLNLVLIYPVTIDS